MVIDFCSDKMLQGYDDEEFSNVPTRRDCEELCLRERSFQCKSAEFDTVALTCTLSRESRRTKPKSFRDARNVDYLENGCMDTSKCDINLTRFDKTIESFRNGSV